MPHRVVLGKADANTNPYYHRTGKIGLFISKPGANVHDCSSGDLIFDSTRPAGLFQTVTDGYVKIPKAKYTRGLFGEEGVINENNWNSKDDIPELNSDTSWLFDALKYVKTDIDDAISGLYEDPRVFRLKFFNNEAATKDELIYSTATSSSPELVAKVLRDLGTLYPSYYPGLSTYVAYGEYLADELVNLGDISSESFVKQMLKDLWRIKDVFPFIDFFNTSQLQSNFYNQINQMNNFQTNVPQGAGTLGNGNINIGDLEKWQFDYDASGSASARFTDIFQKIPIKPSAVETVRAELGGDWISSVSTNFPWSTPFKSVWSDSNSGFPSIFTSLFLKKTPYNISYSDNWRATPTPWRAWTVSGGNIFTDKQEYAAIAKYMKYVLICEWLVKGYGGKVNNSGFNYDPFYSTLSGFSSIVKSDPPQFKQTDFSATPGIFDKAIPFALTTLDTSETSGSLNNPFFNTLPARIDSTTDGVYAFCFQTSCPNHKSWNSIITEQNIDGNLYSFWSGGETTYDTGIDPPEGLPTHVWWNTISRTTTNAATNLPILNIRSNRIKEPQSTKRGFSLRPGLAGVQSNTFIDNGRMYVKFSQPSVFDESEVFFKVYNQPVETGSVVGKVAAALFAVAPEPIVIAAGSSLKTFTDSTSNAVGSVSPTWVHQRGVESFTFDIRHTSEGGDSLVNRKSSDGRYYTTVFPDDFVGEKYSNTDPFILYRDSGGRITYPLTVKLVIPDGVVLSGNSFHNHITWDELQKTGTTTASYGPKDTAGRVSRSIYSCVDPCIKLNMNSAEFSNNALKGFFVSVENYGTMIGAGGWGQYGQMYFDNTKYQTAYPGGGGGGGAGYHPQLASENPKVDWLGADGITAEDRLDGNGDPIFVGGVNTTEEIALAQTAVLTHWNGPNNYVEWGIGYLGVPETYYTGLDEITWNSIGPGKPGTGYMGATETYHTVFDSQVKNANRPYGSSEDLWSNNQFGTLLGENIYERLPGTFSVQTGNPRYFIDGWGNPGTYGSTTIGGKGGGEKSVLTFGYAQFSPFGTTNVLATFSGSGGSCVYVYSDIQEAGSSLGLHIANYNNGIIKAGGGGGSGGIGVPGLPGGKLGRPGGYIPAPLYPSLSADSGRDAIWSQYSRRGEPGKIVWWNAPGMANNYYIQNYSTSTSGSIEGMEYNPSIGSDDYVSYLPNVSITQSGTTFNLYGRRLFSRILVNGQVQYHEMQERTYEDYINQTSDKEFV